MTKDEILLRLTELLTTQFEVERSLIHPEALLNDDLDIDSIDAVDMIVHLKPLVGRRLQPELFKSVRTVQDVVDALHGMLEDGAPN